MKQQSYSSHTRIVPGFHLVTGICALLAFIYGIIRLVKAIMSGNYKFAHLAFTGFEPFLIGLTLLLLFWYTRKFAVTVQDRVIRAEENMRHFMMAGKPLDGRLTMQQIIAIRFAPDEEYQALVKEALDKNLSAADIKQSIKNWKADHARV